MQKCWTDQPSWIAGVSPTLSGSEWYQFQWQNKWRAIDARVHGFESPQAAAADAGCAYSEAQLPDKLIENGTDRSSKRGMKPQFLSIHLSRPMRCLAPGQWAAFFDRQVCLGGAMLRGSLSLWDEGIRSPYTSWSHSDFELTYENVALWNCL
ncbi:unnamed protein product [Protopolystoma xenopodis]|uniref:tRNA-specific 2-thiouridylase MnmA-like C-terminal domain-containing protein n=1 Tax=Protopolystoma xenopodis TaxID=117903 RepID=A0A448XGQ9_9PLAT|nr:unnamed protein product [Protopolystoma xenopodis]